MKKIMLILVISILSLSLTAQTDSLKKTVKVNFGIMLNPQGALSLKNAGTGFAASSPLFVILPIERGNLSFTPIFSLTDNSVGGFISHPLKKIGIYVVGIKSTKSRNLYLGIGSGIPVAHGHASLFLEVGSLQIAWDPLLFLGLSIPFTVR